MKKRGQFYLIATLVIILIMMGFAQIYTLAKAPEKDAIIDNLADEIYYETTQLVNNKAFNGNTKSEIANEIKGFIGYYSNRYNDIGIAIAYGDEALAYIINSTDVTNVVPDSGIVNVNLKGLEYDVDISEKNLYVLILREKDGERGVVIK